METLEPRPRSEWARFLVPFLFLAVMAAALGTLLVVVLSQAGSPGAPGGPPRAQRAWMIRFALVCAVLLGLTLIVMFWMVVRFVGSRLPKPPDHSATEHVDAWSLAGQRVRLADEETPDEPDAPEEPDEEADEPPQDR